MPSPHSEQLWLVRAFFASFRMFPDGSLPFRRLQTAQRFRLVPDCPCLEPFATHVCALGVAAPGAAVELALALALELPPALRSPLKFVVRSKS